MGICKKWLHSTGFYVSQTWKEKVGKGKKLPYGSLIEKPGLGPATDFCMTGNDERMQADYWALLAGNAPASQLGVANPAVYLRQLDTAASVSRSSSWVVTGGSIATPDVPHPIVYFLAGVGAAALVAVPAALGLQARARRVAAAEQAKGAYVAAPR